MVEDGGDLAPCEKWGPSFDVSSAGSLWRKPWDSVRVLVHEPLLPGGPPKVQTLLRSRRDVDPLSFSCGTNAVPWWLFTLLAFASRSQRLERWLKMTFLVLSLTTSISLFVLGALERPLWGRLRSQTLWGSWSWCWRRRRNSISLAPC